MLPEIDDVTTHSTYKVIVRSGSRLDAPASIIRAHVAQHRTVEKIIRPPDPREPEKAEIAIEGADKLYKEIRIDNTLTDENGDEVRLKQGAKVEVTVEAEPEATTSKSRKSSLACALQQSPRGISHCVRHNRL